MLKKLMLMTLLAASVAKATQRQYSIFNETQYELTYIEQISWDENTLNTSIRPRSLAPWKNQQKNPIKLPTDAQSITLHSFSQNNIACSTSSFLLTPNMQNPINLIVSNDLGKCTLDIAP